MIPDQRLPLLHAAVLTKCLHCTPQLRRLPALKTRHHILGQDPRPRIYAKGPGILLSYHRCCDIFFSIGDVHEDFIKGGPAPLQSSHRHEYFILGWSEPSSILAPRQSLSSCCLTDHDLPRGSVSGMGHYSHCWQWFLAVSTPLTLTLD